MPGTSSLLLLPLAAALALGAFSSGSGAPAGAGPVLVELFTSEGCSSCPPADQLLMELDASPAMAGTEVIVLGEHVDYWNRLGWNDPFSSSAFSQRQELYASRLGQSGVYTPQMVVDGRQALVGSDRAGALRAIAAAAGRAKAAVTIALDPGRKPGASQPVVFTARVERLSAQEPGDPADILLAVTEGGLQSQVLGGENSGRRLPHAAVVRSLTTLGAVAPGSGGFTATREAVIGPGWKRANLKLVVFVQGRRSGHVFGVAALPLGPA